MPSILFETRESVAYITLNRPDKYNAFNREMALLLQNTLDACSDKSVRCVYLTGSGKAFCSGQDLAEVIDPVGPAIGTIVGQHYNPIINRIRRLQKPVVAAVNGVAAGAGANLALACDIVVAAEGASFIQAFSKIGLVPDTGGTFFLPRLVGWQRASALMMLGEKVSAAAAESMGMIYKAFPNDVFAEESRKMAAMLAQMPTKALALTKELLDKSFENNYTDQLHKEERFQQRAGQTADFAEGVQAFLEKRPPNFKGE